MEFWASTETHQSAYEAVTAVRKLVEPHLNAAFANSGLAHVSAKLRYVPIVMPENLQARYPARSKLLKEKRIVDCAPVLDYGVFLNGSFQEQVREYLNGVSVATPYLERLGLTQDEILQFKTILGDALDHILTERLDQTRH